MKSYCCKKKHYALNVLEGPENVKVGCVTVSCLIRHLTRVYIRKKSA